MHRNLSGVYLVCAIAAALFLLSSFAHAKGHGGGHAGHAAKGGAHHAAKHKAPPAPKFPIGPKG